MLAIFVIFSASVFRRTKLFVLADDIELYKRNDSLLDFFRIQADYAIITV